MSSIDRILSASPKLSTHLSSRQSFLLLDTLIANAIEPIIQSTSCFQNFMGEVIASFVFSRRKVSEDALTLLFAAMFAEPDKKTALFIEANIDRGFVFLFLNKLQNINVAYRDFTHQAARTVNGRLNTRALKRMQDIEQTLGADESLYGALQCSREWAAVAAQWKSSIIEKHLRSLWARSVSAEKNAVMKFDRQDIFSSSYIIASRVADRFNANNGVFTSYLGRWLTNPVNSKYSNAIGSTFGPSGNRHINPATYSKPIEAATDVEIPTEDVIDPEELKARVNVWVKQDEIARMAMLMHRVAPYGVALAPSKD